MGNVKKDPGKTPDMIPGYGQPPEGVRTDHPDLPDQSWGAQPKEEEKKEERKVPDVKMPDRTPVEGP